jgi:hypothetical protein
LPEVPSSQLLNGRRSHDCRQQNACPEWKGFHQDQLQVWMSKQPTQPSDNDPHRHKPYGPGLANDFHLFQANLLSVVFFDSWIGCDDPATEYSFQLDFATAESLRLSSLIIGSTKISPCYRRAYSCK